MRPTALVRRIAATLSIIAVVFPLACGDGPSSPTDDSSAITSVTSAFRGNKRPVGTITAPASGASFAQGTTITFSGTAKDSEDGVLSGGALSWRSSVDGAFGTGSVVMKNDLSLGQHTITLTSTDSRGASSSTSIQVTITAPAALSNQPPFGLISTPANAASYAQGESIQFSGTATDPEDGALTGTSIVWRSDLDGQIGTGTSFTKSNLSVGQHTITMTSTDSKGASFNHNQMLTITSPVANHPPAVTITAPAANTSFVQGAAVTLTGTGVDPEQGALSGTALVWTSSLNGPIGAGASVTISTLTAGTHTLTLTAKDSLGLSGTATTTITVTAATTNQPPFGLISTPANGSTYVQGTNILFTGSATDPEDGVLSGASIVWRSSINGQIGTGTSFTKNNLSVGQHTITMTSTDSKGATFNHNQTLTITSAPVQPTASQLSIVTQPGSTALSGTTLSPQPTVQLRDALNNAVAQANIVVTATIYAGGGTLGGTTTAATNASGIAVFTNLSISGANGIRTLQFTAPGLTNAVSGAISIGSAAPAGEPFYTAGSGATLVMSDNMDRYSSTTSMGAWPLEYAGPQFAPVPGPSETSTPVDVTHVTMVSPGRNGSGKAVRLAYDGIYQESHNIQVIGAPAQPDNQTVYIQYYARITPSTNWPLSQPLAVKWVEAWHNHSQNTRIQWNTRYPSPDNRAQSAPTVWQVIDQAESTTNGDQPFGPFFHQIANSQWHRFTHAFRPHSSATVKDGYSKMWVDGVLIIDIEQATVGVTPAGGVSPWCSQTDVNNLAAADGVATIRFGGPQTTSTGAWTYDIDDFFWWRQ